MPVEFVVLIEMAKWRSGKFFSSLLWEEWDYNLIMVDLGRKGGELLPSLFTANDADDSGGNMFLNFPVFFTLFVFESSSAESPLTKSSTSIVSQSF